MTGFLTVLLGLAGAVLLPHKNIREVDGCKIEGPAGGIAPIIILGPGIHQWVYIQDPEIHQLVYISPCMGGINTPWALAYYSILHGP